MGNVKSHRKKISQPFIWNILILVLLVGCGAADVEPTPVPETDTPMPIPPTATPTPLSPTATLTPTPTQTPTPTDTLVGSGDSTTNSTYLDEVNLGLQKYNNAYANVNNYVQQSTTDFNVLLDQNWKQNANMALSQLDEAAKQLESIDNPPPEYEQLDMYIKSVAGETHKMVDNYGSGIDNFDPNAINNAINNLANIASFLKSATEELNKYYNSQ